MALAGYLLEVGSEPIEPDALGNGVVAVTTQAPLALLRCEAHAVLDLIEYHQQSGVSHESKHF